MGPIGSKTRSLGQIIEDPMLVTKGGCDFKFYENGRQVSKWVENTVGKEEIACYEQFLLQQCFQKTCTADM